MLLILGVTFIVLALVCFYGLPKVVPKIEKGIEKKKSLVLDEKEQEKRTEKIIVRMKVAALILALAAAAVLAIDTYLCS